MKRVGLVACGSGKRDDGFLHPARGLYTGSFFRVSVRWVEAVTDEWAILSAKHGLLLPDDPVAAYDLSLMSMTPSEREAWGDSIVEAISERWDPEDTVFVSSAGKFYRRALERFPHTEFLIDRMPTGQPRGLGPQMQQMKRETANAKRMHHQ